MVKNVLISTTRQWNPGDEFIMLGCLNALKQTDIFKNQTIGFNPIIFNRNPDIRTGCSWRSKKHGRLYTLNFDKKKWKGKSYYRELFRVGHYDNSFKDDMNPQNIHLALFAGSPEWYGKRLRQMFSIIDDSNIPTVFLGIGAGDSVDFNRYDSVVDRVLKQAKLITTRDIATKELLNDYNAIYVPCPALLSSKSERLVKSCSRIGLIYATNRTLKGNNVSREMHDYIVKLYSELNKKYNTSLVCHYIDEIDEARNEFPNMDIYYSYDSKDYSSIYNQFDLVIGGRVHGIGMSASLGIPGIMIFHDSRSSTTDGFLAEKVQVGTSVDEVCRLIHSIQENLEERSKRIIEHKKQVMSRYVSLLNDNL